MKQDNSIYKELIALCGNVRDESITAEQFERLQQLLRADRAYVLVYVRFMQLQSVLEREAQSLVAELSDDTNVGFTTAELLAEVMEQEQAARQKREAEALTLRQQKEAEARERQQLQRILMGKTDQDMRVMRHYVIPRPVAYGAVAAVIAALIMAFTTFTSDQSRNAIERHVQVATLVDAVDAVWGEDSHAIAVGEPILNQRIALKRGYAKLQFDSQAEITVEGPCVFQPLSDNELRLISGRMVGRCEAPASKGFVVHTAGLRIVDIGTEFGVRADTAGRDEVHVFDGEVDVAAVRGGGSASSAEASSSGQSKLRLRAGKAVHVARGGKLSSVFNAKSYDFVRDTTPEEIDPLRRYARLIRDAKPIAYWRAESLIDGELRNMMGERFHGEVFGRINTIHDSQMGQVLDFERLRSPQANYVDITDPFNDLFAEDYTLECWVWAKRYHNAPLFSLRVEQVPDEVGDESEGAGVVALFGEVSEAQAEAGIGENSVRYTHRDEPAYSLKMGTYIAPSHTYQPGRWHHVVALRRNGIMELYVDGRRLATAVSRADWSYPIRIRIGASDNKPLDRQLEAKLDEFAVYDRALSPDEVAQHHQMLRSTVLMEEESN